VYAYFPGIAAYYVAQMYLNNNNTDSQNDSAIEYKFTSTNFNRSLLYSALVYAFSDVFLFSTLKLSVGFLMNKYKCSTFLAGSIHSGSPFLLIWLVRQHILERIVNDSLFMWCDLFFIFVTLMFLMPFVRDTTKYLQYLRRRTKFKLQNLSIRNSIFLNDFQDHCFFVICLNLNILLFATHVFIPDYKTALEGNSFPFGMNHLFFHFLLMTLATIYHYRVKVLYEIRKPQRRYIVVEQYLCGNARNCHQTVQVLFNAGNVPTGVNVPNYSVQIVEFASLPSWIRRKIPDNAFSAA
jgi:hypothetical protein